jgi:hypothetical protein
MIAHFSLTEEKKAFSTFLPQIRNFAIFLLEFSLV